ncbi:MAG: flagellar hook-basal body complex protein FliE [Treponema sp.]|jgi:flagellar hook-basal body complex protein FliE|nr:flagellar hook-basal body complex protein FliE [Treponema sp.]
MTIYNADAVTGHIVTMTTTHPKHFAANPATPGSIGKNIIELKEKTGADAVIRSGVFEKTMLQALDKVSGDQQFASALSRQAITEPGSVDVHDITIAQAKAGMSLNITRNVLSRLVQDWRDLINTR